jgi:hypothetical protein
VLVRVGGEDLALTRPKVGERRRLEVHQVLLEVRLRLLVRRRRGKVELRPPARVCVYEVP